MPSAIGRTCQRVPVRSSTEGANDPYNALKTTLNAEIDQEPWAGVHSDTSRPFEKPKNGPIAVKVINHLGDEVMNVFRVQ